MLPFDEKSFIQHLGFVLRYGHEQHVTGYAGMQHLFGESVFQSYAKLNLLTHLASFLPRDLLTDPGLVSCIGDKYYFIYLSILHKQTFNRGHCQQSRKI